LVAVAWFANNASLDFKDKDGASLTIAALQGITVEPKYEMVELYGMEDLRRASVARHSLKVNVTVKYAKWDAAADTLFNQVVGSDFTSASKNIPPMFSLVAAFKSLPASAGESQQTQTYTVSDIVFDGVPINMNQNEFITREMSGTGRMVEMSGS
jgi:hypothetical protein